MFLQEHRAGVLGISDFTLLKGEPITVTGEVLSGDSENGGPKADVA